jgi:four helix bundle protein
MSDKLRSGPERLRVYDLAMTTAVEAGRLAARVRCTRARADQLSRAADSMPFNIAEGAMHSSPAQKARYYRIARASAGECEAILTRIAADNPHVTVEPLRRKTRLVSIMLLALIRSMEHPP